MVSEAGKDYDHRRAAKDHPGEGWIQEQVPQCGYCQPGIMMQVAALIAESPRLIRTKSLGYG
jgi:aerobic-type carbon monoxide dehydrogenase small subunit (CoxS/CutS family)